MAHEHFYVKRSERESLVQPELIYTGLLEDAPNWFNIQHSHDFCEILYVAGGAGEAILEGKKFRLAPGDLVVVNPGTCLLYTSPSPRDRTRSRMPSSA